MRHRISRFLILLLVPMLVISCALPAIAAGIDLGVTIEPIENSSDFTVTVTDEADTILAGTSAKLEIPCSFDAAYVEFGGKVLTEATLDTTKDTITFPVAKGGTYTIHNGTPLQVSFNTNSSIEISAQTLPINGKVIRPATNPSKDGYIFSGWYSDEALTTPWDFEDAVTQSMTLYAKWTQGVLVSFNSNGGSIVTAQTLSAGDTVAPPEVTKAGHILVGWYKEPTFVTVWNFNDDTVPSGSTSMTLYAKWKGISVTPATKKLYPGETQTFIATVTGTNSTNTQINWSVSGNNDTDNTKISNTGLLVVSAKETAKTLTVTATGTLDGTTLSSTATVTVCPIYEFKSGSGSKWAKDSSRNLTFVCTGPYADLEKIVVNGQSITPITSYAAAHTDGTQITLKPAFLKNLARGNYYLELHYTDGGYAIASFQVIRASGVANTGDLFNMALWGSLLGISAVGVILLIIVKKRKK